MTKVNHYVNLIGWKQILEIMQSNGCNNKIEHRYFCDTISIKLLAFFLGKKIELVPGPSMTEYVYSLNKSIYLTAYETDFNELVLPMFHNRTEIDAYARGLNINSKNIVIGISSPSQNYLAARLAENIDYDADIYCLGAAIYLDQAYKRKPTFFWIRFMLSQPKRTISKTSQTLKEMFSIVLFRENRKKFKQFLSFLV